MGEMTSSDFLFAQPTLMTGVARLVVLGSQFDVYNASATPELADERATYADWRAVGEDLLVAMADEWRAYEAAGTQQLRLDLR